MRRRSKPNELTVVVLSGSGAETHSLRLTRRKIIVALSCWLFLLLAVAVWGFQSGGYSSRTASSGAAGAPAGTASRQ